MIKKITLFFMIFLSFFESISLSLFASTSKHIVEKEEAFLQLYYNFEEPPDLYFKKQWGLKNSEENSFSTKIDIGIKEAWKEYNGGNREVIVAVIDTGVDMNHEDLSDVFWVNEMEIPENGLDDDGNGYVDDIFGWNFYHNTNVLYMGEEDKHGTHIVGTMIANINDIGISGIVGNSKVKIMVLKALGGKGQSGQTSFIRKAIEYAEKQGAKICNLSFGTLKPDSNLLEPIKNSKMLFFTAAGNGDKNYIGTDLDIIPVYPASYKMENVITVANLDQDGKLHSSSNYGFKSVDFAAPGSRILSTIDYDSYHKLGYLQPYGYMNGTSMAAPMATAVAAMLYSHFPTITLKEVKESILNGVKSLPALQGKVIKEGILNAHGAMEYYKNKILPEKRNIIEKEEVEEDILIEENHSPEILLRKSKNGKVSLRVYDEDEDIKFIKYALGKRKASYFKNGKKGRNIFFKKKGKKSLSFQKGKTYSIFVMDEMGNQALKIFKIK